MHRENEVEISLKAEIEEERSHRHRILILIQFLGTQCFLRFLTTFSNNKGKTWISFKKKIKWGINTKSIIYAKLWHNILNNKEYTFFSIYTFSGVRIEKQSITPTLKIHRLITSPKLQLLFLTTTHLLSQSKTLEYQQKL